jgi:hypothetical protein
MGDYAEAVGCVEEYSKMFPSDSAPPSPDCHMQHCAIQLLLVKLLFAGPVSRPYMLARTETRAKSYLQK